MQTTSFEFALMTVVFELRRVRGSETRIHINKRSLFLARCISREKNKINREGTQTRFALVFWRINACEISAKRSARSATSGPDLHNS